MESLELGRRLKRNCDSYFSYRRVTLVVIGVLVLLMYIIPYLVRWVGVSRSPVSDEDEIDTCLRDRLTSFYSESYEYNVNIRHVPARADEKPYVAYIGNGVFGLEVNPDSGVYIRQGRGLSLATQMYPIAYLSSFYLTSYREAYVTNFLTGIVHVFQCYRGGAYASFQYYAHRTLPSILVQEIKVSNPTDVNFQINVQLSKIIEPINSAAYTVNVKHGDNTLPYRVYTSVINSTVDGGQVIASMVARKFPIKMEVEARTSRNLNLLTSIAYSEPGKRILPAGKKLDVENEAIDMLKNAGGEEPGQVKEHHAHTWQHLWSTGLTIGTSKAKDALNGDKINATMYYVLSQVKVKIEKTSKDSSEVASHLSYAEGCYGNHHTLEAKNLWGHLETVDNINHITSFWLLTLEKHGCHNVLKAGALGVVQAMVLSFGGLRFSNQHLEFSIDPKYLHRDLLFRRVSYGNMTHVNISVVVQEDNKAVLQVALDRSDKNYYACDGGCLDLPVQLGPEKKTFPVKLTQPLTPILYVTYDKQHMEDLRHTIHVKEIVEAPPHEHHVIALHKHGHHLGGLPTFFWVSVSTLILIFHLFLFKLIYNEYCAGSAQDKYRVRYGKL